MIEDVLDYLRVTDRLREKRVDLRRLDFVVTEALDAMTDIEALRNGLDYHIEIETQQERHLSGQLQMHEHLGEGVLEIPLEYRHQGEAQEDGITALMVQNNREALGIAAPLTPASVTEIFVVLGVPHMTPVGDFYITTGGDDQLFNLVIARDKINRTRVAHVSSEVRMRKGWPLSDDEYSALSAAVFMKEFNRDMAGKLRAHLPLSQE